MRKYANRLNKYKAGQSPAVLHPDRKRSFQPGLSWLADDEFESTGLAFRLARHYAQRSTRQRFADRSPVNRGEDTGSDPLRDNRRARTAAEDSNNAEQAISRPRSNLADNRARQRREHPARTHASNSTRSFNETRSSENSRTANQPVTPRPTLERSPASQRPEHVDLGLTDFTSLFGASPTSSPESPSAEKRVTPADAASRRIQLTLEYHGGDYSRLVPDPSATSWRDPSVYAAITMARRRDLGPKRRSSALNIVQGMVGKPLGSQQIPLVSPTKRESV